MAEKGKKPRAKWDSEIERKLIDIWADILKLITRKKKEAVATTRLNVYVSEELSRDDQYTEKAVCNKIDTITKKERPCTSITQRKGRQARSTPKMM